MKTKLFLIPILAVCLFASKCAQAQSPIGGIMSYQGKFTDTNGVPVANGTYSVTFKIYENGALTTPPFSQTTPVIALGGVFSTFLSIGAFTFDPAKAYELGVQRAGSSEQKFTISSVPVASTVPANAISTLKIADGAVTNVKIADGAVTNLKIADGAVTSAKIADGTIANNDLANASVNSAKITDLSIIGADIANGAIADAKIADVAASKITGQISQAQAPFAVKGPGDNFQIRMDRATVTTDANGIGIIPFNQPFNSNFISVVACNRDITPGFSGDLIISVETVNNSGFKIHARRGGAALVGTVYICYIAVGQ